MADTFAGRVHVEWDATAPVTAQMRLCDVAYIDPVERP
jgi:hypothetical protein